MEILKFRLSGKTAFFKKPEVNTYYYFTYGQIHKAALLGIFGAILGYSGYGNPWIKNGNIFFEKQELPEYYQRLKSLKIGIVPCNKNGYIPKKIQTFNNSVGYASEEQGGNLIIREQWLESPKWDIYILINNEESEYIKTAIQDRKAVYIPYLGKNEHPADISEISIYHGEKIKNKKEDNFRIDSLYIKKYAKPDTDDEEVETVFKYEESLPIGVKEHSFMYQLESVVYTNLPVISYQGELYEVTENKKIIAFL